VAENRCVVYQGPNEVTIEDIGYPKLEVPEYVASNMGLQYSGGPSRRDPADSVDQHLRIGPAHGPGPDDGASGDRLWDTRSPAR
jgi:hypothetical protein